MLIKTLPVGYLETNCYVVTNEDDLSCAVIDPGAESGRILNYLEENHLHCSAILVTHGHFDHITALPTVQEETGAPVYVGRGDVDADLGSNRRFHPPAGSVIVGEGGVIEAGTLRFQVLETPGHSPGSLCFLSGHCLFTGDTLFKGSCGRTDFTGGSVSDMMASLQRLARLPGDFEVYPGHMESSTLEAERRYNPYMREAMRG
jgi:glyoxylase-like metal-dependent hydrolase (beta-lactamase superfamily II)